MNAATADGKEEPRVVVSCSAAADQCGRVSSSVSAGRLLVRRLEHAVVVHHQRGRVAARLLMGKSTGFGKVRRYVREIEPLCGTCAILGILFGK